MVDVVTKIIQANDFRNSSIIVGVTPIGSGSYTINTDYAKVIVPPSAVLTGRMNDYQYYTA